MEEVEKKQNSVVALMPIPTTDNDEWSGDENEDGTHRKKHSRIEFEIGWARDAAAAAVVSQWETEKFREIHK